MDIYIMTSAQNNTYTYQVHMTAISLYNFNLQVSQLNKSWRKFEKNQNAIKNWIYRIYDGAVQLCKNYLVIMKNCEI